jgi:hypothetical protein
MTEQIDPPGTDGIEVALPVHPIEPGSFAPADSDQRKRFVLLHLSAGVPDRLPAAIVYVFIIHLLEIQHKKPYY